ncbi:hypothetical protein [Candidatus Planktophila versatilis]|nr:hypothetical protein [Candidatus Planktophila versatilis]
MNIHVMSLHAIKTHTELMMGMDFAGYTKVSAGNPIARMPATRMAFASSMKNNAKNWNVMLQFKLANFAHITSILAGNLIAKTWSLSEGFA